MTFPIGSISTGTLKTSDLLSAFADTVESLASAGHIELTPVSREWLSEIDALYESDADIDYDESVRDSAESLLEEMTMLLEEAAPDGLYFGSHEGDGADFGFWPNQDFLDNPSDYDFEKVSEIPEQPGNYIQVSDHGNVMVGYVDKAGTFHEIWSCV